MIKLRNLTIIIVCIVVFVGVFGPILHAKINSPPGTTYVYAYGFTPDYYQFISWIGDGSRGKILLTTRYTQKVFPATFIHPLFPLVGLTGALFHINPFVAYLITRIAITGLFLIVLFVLINKSIPSTSGQILALVLLTTQTGIWQVKTNLGKTEVIEPVTGITDLNVIGKFALLPHHILALCGMIVIFLLLSTNKQTSRRLALLAGVTILIGIFNPATLTLSLLTLVVAALVFWILSSKRRNWKQLLPFGAVIVTGIFALTYYWFVFSHRQPWIYWYQLMKAYRPPISFLQYLLALGPLVLFAPIPLIVKKFYQNRLDVLLALWAFLPILLFGFIHIIPINFQRLLQSYQYIPIALLGALGIQILAKKLSTLIPYILTVVTIGAFLTVYGLGAFYYSYIQNQDALAQNLYNIYPPNSFIHILTWLEEHEPKEVIVLSGDYMSSMIPAFTKQKVIIGKEDSAPDYSEKQHLAFDLFDDKLTPSQAHDFLQKYGVSYIIYGIDTRPFIQTSSYTFPFLHEVITDGSASLVAVRY